MMARKIPTVKNQKKAIIKSHMTPWYADSVKKYPKQIHEIVWFSGLPAEEAQKLLTGKPNVDPKDYQNFSPTARRMVQIAKKHDGYIGGYMIPVESGRKDARISFDTLFLPVKKAQAEKIKEDLCKPLKSKQISNHCPDEFDPWKIGNQKVYRYWWD